MSNISRRDFLKTAGVMTLAVAAAGVLAGCEGNAAPAPEANKPEVTTNSVSYTGLYGDKLTVESLGRFNVYEKHEDKEPKASQTVLKVTYTIPSYTAVGSIVGIAVATEYGQKAVSASFDEIHANLKNKFGIDKDAKIAALNSGTVAVEGNFKPTNALKVEKYIVLKSKDVKTNDLKISVAYTNENGDDKGLTMPLSVTASDLY